MSTDFPSTSFTLDPDFVVGKAHPRLFGSFLEHMGRCVYTGVFEPGHPAADEHGLRQDVLELTRELGVTIVRYPGGNFVSGYRWEDGVGPSADRPVRLDNAWRSIDDNAFGLNEFMLWAGEAGVEPIMTFNLGTRGIQEALDLWEYSNHAGGSAWSDLRRAHGITQPHNIRVWCLGNELDGPWQLGAKTADEYGRLAAETGRGLRRMDSTLELVVAGSSNTSLATFAAWEATVLTHAYEQVDYISVHAYYEQHGDDRDSFLASAVHLDRYIDTITATADHIKAKGRYPKTLMLALDEWNVWYQQDLRLPDDWTVAPRIAEDTFSVTDAVVVGSLLISLLRHSDRVGIACISELVNAMAPIRTEPMGPAWRQTTFHPFATTANNARGTVLRVEPQAPMMDTALYGPVPTVDAVATFDDDAGVIAVFMVNRQQHSSSDVTIRLTSFETTEVVDHLVLADADPEARNTAEDPNRVQMQAGSGTELTGGYLRVTLAPLSWSVIRVAATALVDTE
ncbi:MAG TPA: alpha-N-arabinofuranosidase [Propionibacteriaceae bacterium]|jgi:alpha-N-arabinofuranosidase